MTLLATTRRSRIMDLLHSQDSVRTEEIAQSLGVSVETVRRDLARLEQSGELTRVHGGAVAAAVPGSTEPAFDTREEIAAEAKTAVARTAAELMTSAHTIFIDIGTTATTVARQVPSDLRATVITPSIRVAQILAEHPSLSVLMVGGLVRAGDLATSGATAVDFLREVHPDVAFLGSGGLSVQHGLTDYELGEVPVKRMVLHNSHRTFVLADSSKVGVVAPWHVCALTDMTGVITDSGLPRRERESLEAAGVGLLIA
ncbi:DeoR/GlpR family DNA-binding transcription regulator [Aeromicrobium sp. CTD01-1L150]|uniref:DeoR/GlpR family DNA-binding transcription regulator n=1 Tax=Aeromicrobium sp. CTD01-1L150 TaxID=3341830 RepID=UPI0035C1F3CB